ncbi:MAG: GNAT family N-acetyltransferase [Nanoarchaeota archaeon]|jgi:N-acetylglutamate synthase-like GNAT family acetyltransferase|nr:GNAT family N-acetyltransferase [Nanoarchaeota archaeon]
MILKAKESDFESIFNLLTQLWPNKKLDKKKIHTLFSQSLRKKTTIDFVLKNEELVIGFASIKFMDNFYVQGKIAILSELIIDESVKRQGFGTKLLNEVIVQSKKCGCKEIQFNSSVKRRNAHKFYRSLGFDKTAYYFWKTI